VDTIVSPDVLKLLICFNICIDTNSCSLKFPFSYTFQVVSVTETEDHKSTGRWNVKVKNVVNGNSKEYTVDAVCVCSGANSDPIIPTFPGERA